jgi:hypothetical protein
MLCIYVCVMSYVSCCVVVLIGLDVDIGLIESKIWTQLQEPPVSPRSCHSLVFYDDMVYLFGGFNGETVFNDLYCFDTGTYSCIHITYQLSRLTSVLCCVVRLVSWRWHRLEGGGTKPQPVASCSMVACQGSLYVFGGNDREGNYFNMLYQYNIGMQSRRIDATHFNYIIGQDAPSPTSRCESPNVMQGKLTHAGL